MYIAFTIATANYLAQAKALSDSLLLNNREYRFFIILLDKTAGRFDISFFAPAEILEVESLQLEYFTEMAGKYSIFELSNALKPFVAEFLLKTYADVESLVYFDSDILIFNSLSYIHDYLSRFSIIISPHVFTPIPEDGLLPDEKAHLNIGVYNGGFFAVSGNGGAQAFLTWWKQQLRKYCFVDLSQGLFVDQIWLNPVPVYFKNTLVLDHPGYNAAYWNLHERTVSKKENKYHVNDSALVFYHFSGYDFAAPEKLSKYQTRYAVGQRKDVLPLFEAYHEKVMANNYSYFKELPCLIETKKQQNNIESNGGNKMASTFKERVKEKVKSLLRKYSIYDK